jgi:hypothetical protein
MQKYKSFVYLSPMIELPAFLRSKKEDVWKERPQTIVQYVYRMAQASPKPPSGLGHEEGGNTDASTLPERGDHRGTESKNLVVGTSPPSSLLCVDLSTERTQTQITRYSTKKLLKVFYYYTERG